MMILPNLCAANGGAKRRRKASVTWRRLTLALPWDMGEKPRETSPHKDAAR